LPLILIKKDHSPSLSSLLLSFSPFDRVHYLVGMFLLYALLPLLSQSANVLFLPSSFFPSHSIPMQTLADNLISKGHSVSWIEMGPLKVPIQLNPSVHREHWEVSLDDPSLSHLLIHRNASSYQPWTSSYEGETIPLSTWLASIRVCHSVLSLHKNRFEGLLNQKFDTVIVEDQFNPCGLVYSSLIGAVFIYWSQSALRPESAWAHHSPSPPSYIPVPGTKLTDTLDFYERSYNLFYYLRSLYIHQHIIQPRMDAMVERYFPLAVSSFSMERNASLNFINTPPIFDFPRPFMPRVVFVGCIHCRLPQSLPSDLESFISHSPFILVSFGFPSLLSSAPSSVVSTLFNAFSSRPSIKFVVQYEGDRILPPNVIARPFLPLQDLLGHSSCIAHISTGGLNSVIESVWHGIPVIGLPLLFPSYDNLLRLSSRGAAIIVSKKSLSLHSLTHAIDEIQRKKFKDQVLIFQDMLRDVPYAELEHATFWVEFIERHHEIPHSRSGADQLTVIQYFLVDVFLFLLSSLYIILYLSYLVLSGLLSLISSSVRPVSKKRKNE
ncbi:hypothetical protein PMAYCL1PPCAC_06865, partial [Pristionchus mayeri]